MRRARPPPRHCREVAAPARWSRRRRRRPAREATGAPGTESCATPGPGRVRAAPRRGLLSAAAGGRPRRAGSWVWAPPGGRAAATLVFRGFRGPPCRSGERVMSPRAGPGAQPGSRGRGRPPAGKGRPSAPPARSRALGGVRLSVCRRRSGPLPSRPPRRRGAGPSSRPSWDGVRGWDTPGAEAWPVKPGFGVRHTISPEALGEHPGRAGTPSGPAAPRGLPLRTRWPRRGSSTAARAALGLDRGGGCCPGWKKPLFSMNSF